MSKKKLIIISIVLLIFSAIGYAVKNLSEPSKALFKELGEVVQQINERDPDFYNRQLEIKKTQEEFRKGTPLWKYAEEIRSNMKNIGFKIRQTQDLQLTFPIEYFEWLEKKGKQIGDQGSLPNFFWKEAKKIIPAESNWGECKNLFKKVLLRALRLAFKDNPQMLLFINNELKQMNYDTIKKLFDENNKEIKNIFREQKRNCFHLNVELEKKFKPTKICGGEELDDNLDSLGAFLRDEFKNDESMIDFINKNLMGIFWKVNYEEINRLFDKKNDKIGRIFNEKQEERPSHFVVKDDVLKICEATFWMPDKRDFCKELAENFEALVGYSAYDLKKNNVIDEEKVPKLLVPYEPKNTFHNLNNVVEKVFRRYIAESITFKKLFKAVSGILNIQGVVAGSPEWQPPGFPEEFRDTRRKDYTVIVFPLSAKKTFPKRTEDFTGEYVNSARNKDHLVIYHKEEMLKALLHELNHNIKLEFGIKNFKEGHFAINNKNEYTKYTATFEVIVESMACITNVIMTAYEMYPKTFWGSAINMWEREKLFAIYQAAKILYLNNFDNLKQFYEPEDNPKVQQTTWAAEYHILKAAIIQNINKLLEIFMDRKYKDKNVRAQAIERLVNEQIKDTSFEKKIDGFIEAFNNKWISHKKTIEWKLGRPNPKNFLFETGRFALIHPKF